MEKCSIPVVVVDFNTSTDPLSKAVVVFSNRQFAHFIARLNASGTPFQGAKETHLVMMTIEFRDPDGYFIKVNQPGESSPSWLIIKISASFTGNIKMGVTVSYFIEYMTFIIN